MPELLYFEPVYQRIRMEQGDALIIEQLKRKDEATFEQVFKAHFKSLHSYAVTMLKEEAPAEEMVQNVFYKLWERADSISITGSVVAYLYRAVHNESLNYLKHLRVRSIYQSHTVYHMKEETDNAAKKIMLKELEEKIHTALNELPEQCRTIFQMSRFDELKYREIAAALDISVKTVENQMGKALKLLRVKLVDFLPLFIFFINQLLK